MGLCPRSGFRARVTSLLLLLGLSGCAPQLDRKVILGDLERELPHSKIQDMLVVEGDNESQEWKITALDSAGIRRTVHLAYAFDNPGGWRLYFHRVK